LRIAADDLTEASRAIERAAYSDDPKVAARLAFHIQRKAKAAAALLTEPEAKGGDPDTHVDDDGRTADRTDPNGAEPTNIAQPARDPDPVPATMEKTDD